MINFNALPQESPNMKPEAGTYKAKLTTKLLHKNDKDSIQVSMSLTDYQGKACGKVNAFINELKPESKDLPKYILGRFLSAIGIDLSTGGEIALSDVAKLAEGQEIGVDIWEDSNNTKYMTVDPFSGDIYYTLEELEERFKKLHPDLASSAVVEQKILDVPEGAEEQEFDTETKPESSEY